MYQANHPLLRILFPEGKKQTQHGPSPDQWRKNSGKTSSLSTLGNSKRTLRRRPATVGTQFKISIGALLNNLTSKHCQFVRCIKPNESRLSRVFDMTLVQHQIRYLGYVSLCHQGVSRLDILTWVLSAESQLNRCHRPDMGEANRWHLKRQLKHSTTM